ncbi:hypothetical protein Tco_0302840 [Tanacetum coccineum]
MVKVRRAIPTHTHHHTHTSYGITSAHDFDFCDRSRRSARERITPPIEDARESCDSGTMIRTRAIHSGEATEEIDLSAREEFTEETSAINSQRRVREAIGQIRMWRITSHSQRRVLQGMNTERCALSFWISRARAARAETILLMEIKLSEARMIVELLKEEKVYVNFSNNMEAKPRGSYLEEEGIKWQGFGSILSRREREIACTLRHLKVLMKDCMTNVSRWMKLFNEYGFEAKYHLGKANVVVESWSRKKSEAKNKFWIDV